MRGHSRRELPIIRFRSEIPFIVAHRHEKQESDIDFIELICGCYYIRIKGYYTVE